MVLNKIDLLDQNQIAKLPSDWIPVSLLKQTGLERFREAFNEKIQEVLPGQKTRKDFYINQRHQTSLLRAEEHLALVLQSINHQQPLDMISIDLRGALMRLRDVTGENLSQDVIQQIFERFCVGK